MLEYKKFEYQKFKIEAWMVTNSLNLKSSTAFLLRLV